jgi:hypothetical protein
MRSKTKDHHFGIAVQSLLSKHARNQAVCGSRVPELGTFAARDSGAVIGKRSVVQENGNLWCTILVWYETSSEPLECGGKEILCRRDVTAALFCACVCMSMK